MAFTPKTWINEDPVTGVSPTPLDAAALIDLETRLGTYVDTRVANPWAPGIENFHRAAAGSQTNNLVSGTLTVTGGFVIPKGVTVNGISFVSNSGATTPTNQWFCLIAQSDRSVLAKTVDATTAAWGANVVKNLALSAPYTASADIAVYAGIVVVAATPVSLRGSVTSNNVFTALAPPLAATSTTGLTNPASLGATAAALVTSTHTAIPYAFLT